jgi:hypothetical protein
MSAPQIVIGVLGLVAHAVLIAGLLTRGHYRREPVFLAYVVAALTTNMAVGLWHRWDVWLIHQAVTAGLRFAVAIAVAVSVFRNFPGAVVTARRVTFMVLGLTLVAVLSLPAAQPTYTDIVAVVIPRIANGTVWLFTAIAALVLWYRLPLSKLQKAILVGFAPYLLVFTVTMNLLSSVGWHVRAYVGYADTLAYLALLTYWSGVAWRAEAREALDPRRRAMATSLEPVTARVERAS